MAGGMLLDRCGLPPRQLTAREHDAIRKWRERARAAPAHQAAAERAPAALRSAPAVTAEDETLQETLLFT